MVNIIKWLTLGLGAFTLLAALYGNNIQENMLELYKKIHGFYSEKNFKQLKQLHGEGEFKLPDFYTPMPELEAEVGQLLKSNDWIRDWDSD